MKCEICGRKINPSKNNFILIDGNKAVHRRCPREPLSKEESEKYKQLMDRITYHLNVNPRGYVCETGLNFKKVAIQIKTLKDKGYSYEDQLYALEETVKAKEGFWGYSSVLNNIGWIISKRNEKLKKQEQIKKIAKNDKAAQQIYDLSDMIKEDNDKWI